MPRRKKINIVVHTPDNTARLNEVSNDMFLHIVEHEIRESNFNQNQKANYLNSIINACKDLAQ